MFSSSTTTADQDALSLPVVVGAFRNAKTLQESEQVLQAFQEMTPQSGSKEKWSNFLLDLQFKESPYHETYTQALAALEAGEIRIYTDLMWDAFEQATEWGKWSPRRIHLMRLAYGEILRPKTVHLLEKKDLRRLRGIFYNPTNELVPVRVTAASFLSMAPIDMISAEEKLEILRAAIAMEPTGDELSRYIIYSWENNVPVSSILKQYKEHLKLKIQGIESPVSWYAHPVEGSGVVGNFECVPAEVNPHLHQRTTQIGGCKCDYCKTTVEELGVTTLQHCSQCENAFYCGATCQRKAWKEGHKEACRPADCFVPGDMVRLVGLTNKPHMNGRLVKVVKADVDLGKCAVHLCLARQPGDDTSKLFAVKTKSLLHIRPAA